LRGEVVGVHFGKGGDGDGLAVFGHLEVVLVQAANHRVLAVTNDGRHHDQVDAAAESWRLGDKRPGGCQNQKAGDTEPRSHGPLYRKAH
jgi:hypothetical protein